MVKRMFLILLIFFSFTTAKGQVIPEKKKRNYISDSIRFIPSQPWKAAGELVGLNMGVWSFDRFVMNEDFARINSHSIKRNLKTLPVWDTDKFSTNLFAHPYHGSLYFNSARSNGLSFWQSIPYTVGGSLMWEFFMEVEPPSINDLFATSFGGIELGEITYRISDLFLDDRTIGLERVGREILSGLISPMRGINRLIAGDSWRYRPYKGRAFSKVPVDFTVRLGSRYLSEEENLENKSLGMQIMFQLDYGDLYENKTFSPYEWFYLNFDIDLLSSQPLISQVNAIGMILGKSVWAKENKDLTAGIFQHFDYYDSQLKIGEEKEKAAPYRISEAAAVGGGLIYQQKSSIQNPVDIYASSFLNTILLGASTSDYFRVDERDYNMGSGYSFKNSIGLTYKQRWNFLINLENYQIFTWKGYDPDTDWSTVDPNTLNVQGDKGNARLTVFSVNLMYSSSKKWNILLSSRQFFRRTHYKYYDDIEHSTMDIRLSFGIEI
ncbi:MAG: DUF3943 domain-containing protein [Massilibacteroides sp.]|nr:DUF3943 domain-containing protein [Massilibacteroides sp.]MDD3063608.1 DUF3943 domain-containing protein [Massilibacteroides sp.]MDD4115352.1 DUF3943 domain-containing protein [Massilibacteroides sp.]MDD4659836.1 DUF3943 domain-containing protein [Massilibacteroides sp.]